MQAREEDRPSEFIPPQWAYKFTKENLPYRVPDMKSIGENFWYIEVGGDGDSIRDTEKARDELVKIAYGVWDYVKNAPENKEQNQNWRLDWLGMLPGKRESRRYIGDHVMSQKELLAGGNFPDEIAYGGWSMDDHHPSGFFTHLPPTTYHDAPSPYGIPYRSLYSKNIENLFFAGRNISITHSVLSSARVMATCALLGQAMGTAAAIALNKQVSPRGVYEGYIDELQQTLLDDDCFLPHIKRRPSLLTQRASLVCKTGEGEVLRNGVDRPLGEEDNGLYLPMGERVEYHFDSVEKINRIRLVFDSDLNDETLPAYEKLLKRNMLCNRPLNLPDTYVPRTMTKAYQIEGLMEDGTTIMLVDEKENHQRLRKYEVNAHVKGVRFTPLQTWGEKQCHLFAFDVQ